jgi:N-carbamoylputrescine amidase
MGAGLLLYPTAIGSEPSAIGGLETREMWQRVMIGHAVANCCYVAAANRIASENVEGLIQTYYGSSFISDYMGNKIQEAAVDSDTILYAEIDLDGAASFRAGMGFFRDRRPELYTPLLTLDGNARSEKR